jgi:hypothetical protein
VPYFVITFGITGYILARALPLLEGFSVGGYATIIIIASLVASHLLNKMFGVVLKKFDNVVLGVKEKKKCDC